MRSSAPLVLSSSGVSNRHGRSCCARARVAACCMRSAKSGAVALGVGRSNDAVARPAPHWAAPLARCRGGAARPEPRRRSDPSDHQSERVGVCLAVVHGPALRRRAATGRGPGLRRGCGCWAPAGSTASGDDVRPVLREGSRAHAAFAAYQAAVAQGYTGLKLGLIEAIARHGGNCWRRNSDLAKQLGTKWRSSIWRAAHELKADRLLRIQRVLPGHRPQGSQKRATQGTSSKFLDFRLLGCPEAVEDWRRPDTAKRDPGRSAPPQPSAPPPRQPPPPEPEYLSPAEGQAAARAAIAGLDPKR